MAVLVFIANSPLKNMFGLDNLFFLRKEAGIEKGSLTTGKIKVPETDNPSFKDLPLLDRRRMLKNLITIPVMGGFSYAVLKNFGYESYEEKNLKTRSFTRDREVNAVSSATFKFNNFSTLTDLKEQVPQGQNRQT